MLTARGIKDPAQLAGGRITASAQAPTLAVSGL